MREGYVGSITFRQSPAPSQRHCEEQSDEAIHLAVMPRHGLLRFARNDGGCCVYGISYTTILSAMPRSAACFWIGLIASLSRIAATAADSITGPVMWISCEVDRLWTRAAILTVWPK